MEARYDATNESDSGKGNHIEARTILDMIISRVDRRVQNIMESSDCFQLIPTPIL